MNKPTLDATNAFLIYISNIFVAITPSMHLLLHLLTLAVDIPFVFVPSHSNNTPNHKP